MKSCLEKDGNVLSIVGIWSLILGGSQVGFGTDGFCFMA